VDGHQAIREVYAASAARLVAQLFGVTGDYAEAQDVVQEAFVRLLARPGRFRQLDNPEAWLRTVALNVARSRHRRRQLFDRLLRSGRLGGTERGMPELSPDHVVLVEAMQRLPRGTREAVVLYHIGDLPVTEVAAALGCSVEAVKTRLFRGRQALAKYLADVPAPVGDPAPAPRTAMSRAVLVQPEDHHA
jgi:RNA polymerase sigma-70 factor (ECF subfamily)